MFRIIIMVILGVLVFGAKLSGEDPTRHREMTPLDWAEQLKIDSTKIALKALKQAYYAGYIEGSTNCNKRKVRIPQ